MEKPVWKRCPICARRFPDGVRACVDHELPLVESRLDVADPEDGTLTGTVIDGRYLLGPLAGRGGMGAVYESENLRIGRMVAVKVLHKELHADPKMRVRLFREVQATSRIIHPNVVEIFDYGEDPEAGTFLVMEYLDGESLGTILRQQGILTVDVVLKIALQLGSALAATHDKGLIHRDLKPSNIRILPDGTAKVLDFGLVKAFERTHNHDFMTITTGGIAFGTPWYMSPEQAGFLPLDPRSDLYSLGIVLYELLTGSPPFRSDNAVEVLDAQRHTPPPLPSKLDPPVLLPTSLELMLLKLLHKAPRDRHQSVMEVMDDLYAIADEQGIDVLETSASGGSKVSGSPPAQGVPRPSSGELEGLTEVMTATFWPPSAGFDAKALASANLDKLVHRVADQLQLAIPRYRTEQHAVLLQAVRQVVEVGIDALTGEPLNELPANLRKLADDRSDKAFTVSELLAALLLGLSEGRLMLQPANQSEELANFVALHRDIDRRLIPLVIKLVDYYFSRYNRRLIRLNDMLSRRNEELQQLRTGLADQLRNRTSQLAQLEQLKAKVTDNISSGLMLLEPNTHSVLMFNKAMERLCGIPTHEVLHRPFEDIMHFVDGLPFEEFLEQLRLRGEVGLRKLRLLFANGAERSVFIRGQTFFGPDRQPTGTLFVLDDMTERDLVMDSFSRYITKDTVTRILRRRGSAEPKGRAEQAVVLISRIPEFTPLVMALTTAEITDLLTEYLSVVTELVMARGGVIDGVTADRVWAHFSGINAKTCIPPVEAALDICRRIAEDAPGRQQRNLSAYSAALSAHVGQVSILDVGGKQRMVHTIAGAAVDIAEDVAAAAQAGEVLVTPDVRDRFDRAYRTEPGPIIQTGDGLASLPTHRVLWLVDNDAPPHAS